MAHSDSLLELIGIRKAYSTPDSSRITILEDINLTLRRGETIAIVGESGSGKSTLLSVAALLLAKDSGRILYSGQDTDQMSKGEITALRRESLGFVFQASLLLEDFSALENIAMPLLIRGEDKRRAFSEAERFLSLVGLKERAKHRPNQLSGGERQRVAIARALIGGREIIFADEPTGSLDENNSREAEAILFNAVREEGAGLILVTHNRAFAAMADCSYELKGGRLEECSK